MGRANHAPVGFFDRQTVYYLGLPHKNSNTIYGDACDDVFASCPDNWIYLYHSREASIQDSTIKWFVVNIAVHPDLVLCFAFVHRIMQEQSSGSSVSDRDLRSTQAVIWSLIRCSPYYHRAYLILHGICPRSVTQGNQYSCRIESGMNLRDSDRDHSELKPWTLAVSSNTVSVVSIDLSNLGGQHSVVAVFLGSLICVNSRKRFAMFE